ncbi:hypothetical protein [Streptomyces sp. NPDC050759]|uniref:hypothetical protein n=1 Tax=Streptomyces sp. NPDC050759 TaxID=3365635 RepID=UPI00378A5050
MHGRHDRVQISDQAGNLPGRQDVGHGGAVVGSISAMSAQRRLGGTTVPTVGDEGQ